MDSNVSKYLKYKQKYLEQKAGMMMYARPPRRPIHIQITNQNNCDDISVTEVSPSPDVRVPPSPDVRVPPSPDVRVPPSPDVPVPPSPDVPVPTPGDIPEDIPEDKVLIVNKKEEEKRILVPKILIRKVISYIEDGGHHRLSLYLKEIFPEKEYDRIIKLDLEYYSIIKGLLDRVFNFNEKKGTCEIPLKEENLQLGHRVMNILTDRKGTIVVINKKNVLIKGDDGENFNSDMSELRILIMHLVKDGKMYPIKIVS